MSSIVIKNDNTDAEYTVLLSDTAPEDIGAATALTADENYVTDAEKLAIEGLGSASQAATTDFMAADATPTPAAHNQAGTTVTLTPPDGTGNLPDTVDDVQKLLAAVNTMVLGTAIEGAGTLLRGLDNGADLPGAVLQAQIDAIVAAGGWVIWRSTGTEAGAKVIELNMALENNLTDSGHNSFTATSNNITFSSSVYYSGAYSAQSSGSNAYIRVPSHANLLLGTDDFDIQFAYKMGSGDLSSLVFLAGSSNAALNDFQWYTTIDNRAGQNQKLQLTMVVGGVSKVIETNDPYSTAFNKINIIRVGTELSLWLNDVKQATTHNIGTDAVRATTGSTAFGLIGDYTGDTYYPTGYWDAIKITRG